MLKNKWYVLTMLMSILVFGSCPAMAQESKKFKVLVVMSYEEDTAWCMEVRQGIDFILAKTCDIKYFYMNTYKNLQGGVQKAREAYALYQEFQPDGVIVSDDNAQAMFVLPYLKDKVKTPVMFCGVNEDAETYGYPASNISGVLERYLINESIALGKQLIPSIATFGFIMKKSSTSEALFKQIKSESDMYMAKFISFKEPASLKEALTMTEELGKSCDVIFVSSLAGIPDEKGNSLTDKEAFSIILKTFGKPVIGPNVFNVRFGALCGVSQIGAEQGEKSSEMLLKAMNGTPVSQIPIIKNHNGKRMINVTVMKDLGIKPNSDILGSAELVKTEN
jgi:ABC-type uncharacterized transport system substrate-binding protein